MSIANTAAVGGGGESDVPCISILLVLVVLKLIHPAFIVHNAGVGGGETGTTCMSLSNVHTAERDTP